jgi:tetratricopeptide (TPR) repeat protein
VRRCALAIVVAVAIVAGPGGSARLTAAQATDRASLADAQYHFYSARYVEAAAAAQALLAAQPDDLELLELRTSALHFQLRREMGDGKDRKAAFAKCAACPALLATFGEDMRRGRALAQARLVTVPDDPDALFFLGKIDLNHVWLHLGTLGRRTGWDEYWEARRSLDTLLKANPSHVRGRIARAWIDYIVNTKVPWGTRWMMGGGSKTRALTAVRQAAAADADVYARVEAEFALLEMQQREGNRAEAVELARALLVRFPDNEDLAKLVQ